MKSNLIKLTEQIEPTKLTQRSSQAKLSVAATAPFAVWLVISLLTVIVVSLVLAGCAQQGQVQTDTQTQAHAAAPPSVPTVAGTMTTTVTVTAITTQTGTPEPEGTGTPNNITAVVATHEAFETGVAEHRQQIQTEVALTHEPTTTPGRPAEQPTSTPILGMLPGCSNTNAYGPQAISCWRGVVDGELVDVDSGREGLDGDPTQGIVMVHVWGHGQQQDEIYQTPNRVGAVSITSVNGMLFTLTTIDQPTPQQFVFDLVNRRWVSP